MLEVVEASEAATGCQVDEAIGDCAYGAGETRAEFAASGRTLVARVPAVDNQGYFPKTAFRIDLEAGTCTCPNGQTTAEPRPAQDGGGLFVFATETCAGCLEPRQKGFDVGGIDTLGDQGVAHQTITIGRGRIDRQQQRQFPLVHLVDGSSELGWRGRYRWRGSVRMGYSWSSARLTWP